MTAMGIDEMKAEITPMKPRHTASVAAPPMTQTEKTRVTASTPMFSP